LGHGHAMAIVASFKGKTDWFLYHEILKVSS
jgi:hypothetical protein